MIMTAYDASGKPLPGGKAYVMVDPKGNRTFVDDPTQFFEAGKVRYDATRALVPEVRGQEPPPPVAPRAPVAGPPSPVAGAPSGNWPAAGPKTPKLVLQLPGSVMGRGKLGNADIARFANDNFASVRRLDPFH